MKFRIETRVNDGMAEAPPYELEVATAEGLIDEITTELSDDGSESFPVGGTVFIERVA